MIDRVNRQRLGPPAVRGLGGDFSRFVNGLVEASPSGFGGEESGRRRPSCNSSGAGVWSRVTVTDKERDGSQGNCCRPLKSPPRAPGAIPGAKRIASDAAIRSDPVSNHQKTKQARTTRHATKAQKQIREKLAPRDKR